MYENLVLMLLVFVGLPLLFFYLLGSALLWAASSLMNFSDKSAATAFKVTALSFIVCILSLGLALLPWLFDPVRVISLLLLPLAAILSVAAYFILVNRAYGEEWKNTILACFGVLAVGAAIGGIAWLVFMVVGVAIWQLGVFNPPTSTVMKGWTVLQPLYSSISYQGDAFGASLVNAKGTSIIITSVKIREVLQGTSCSVTLPSVNQTVAAGSAFQIKAACPGKKAGDPYETDVEVVYNSVIGGLVTTNREQGTIRGTAE